LSASPSRAVRNSTGTSDSRRKAAAELEAGRVGQHHIEQDAARPDARDLLDRVAPARRVVHDEALGLEEVAHQAGDLLVVFDEQDRRAGRARGAHGLQCG